MASHRTIVLRTDRLLVRTATTDDVDLFCALWNDPRVMANVGFPHGLRATREDIRSRLARQTGRVLDQLLVVELRGTGKHIGECHLHSPDDEGIAEADVKLLPAFWGRGYGTEIWKALVDYEFTHTDCDVVQGTPNVKNTASIRMQESAGAVRVGEGVFHFPESERDHTTPVHHYVYQVRRSDWERRRAVDQPRARTS